MCKSRVFHGSMSLSGTVSLGHSASKWRDLENCVRGRSRSFQIRRTFFQIGTPVVFL